MDSHTGTLRSVREESNSAITSPLKTQCASFPPRPRATATKKAAGCLRNIQPRFSLGCPEASQELAELEATVLVAIFIFLRSESDNTAKTLETGKSSKIIRLAAILQNY